ncbi:MAG: hypothetical protein HQM09_08685 [Candidatus Riflebacteria bacterium]|nr:hypothetical protein [Candidatus Riflebacteria bacterium]
MNGIKRFSRLACLVPATSLALFLIILLTVLAIGCSGGGGGEGGQSALSVATDQHLSLSGSISFATLGAIRSGSARSAQIASISSLQIVLKDTRDIVIAGPVRPDDQGRYAFTALTAGWNLDLAVMTGAGRILLRRSLDRLDTNRSDLAVNPESTALSALFHIASGSRTVTDLEAALGSGTLEIGSLLLAISRWIETSLPSDSSGDVIDGIVSAVGRPALEGLISGTSVISTPATPAASFESIQLVQPATDTIITAGTDLTLEAAVTATGPIRKIEFYQNEFKIGEVSSPPYIMTWTKIPACRTTLVARLVHLDWSRLSSKPRSLTAADPENLPPQTPSILEPASGVRGLFGSVQARSSAFVDPNSGDFHLSSDWEVSTDPGFATGSIAWRRSSEVVGKEKLLITGLATGTTFWIHVRHRDDSGAVSSWSAPVSFSTMGFAPRIAWSRCYGGSGDDVPMTVVPTTDGGLLILGSSRSSDGDVGSNNGGWDIWLLRLDGVGNILWKRVIGGVGYDTPLGIIPGTGGSFRLLATSDSPDGDFFDLDETGNPKMGRRALVQEIQSDGSLKAGFFIYPPLLDYPVGLADDGSGNLLIGGNSYLRDGNFRAGAPFATVARVKPGPQLDGVWNGKEWNGMTLAQVTSRPEGGFTTVGILTSPGTVAATGAAQMGIGMVSAIGADGRLAWRQVVTDSDISFAPDDLVNFPIKSSTTPDRGTLIAYVSGMDAQIRKLDSGAADLWRRTLPFFLPMTTRGFQDGSCMIAGLGPYSGGEHGWCRFARLDAFGNLLGSRNFGGKSDRNEFVAAVCTLSNGAFVTVSYTESTDGDVSGNHGGGDIWVVQWKDQAE